MKVEEVTKSISNKPAMTAPALSSSATEEKEEKRTRGGEEE